MSWLCCCCCSTEDKYDKIPSTKDNITEKLLVPDHTPQYEMQGVPKDKTWYHGNISEQEANERLRNGAKGVNGSYLVYDNPSQRKQLILLVYYKGEGVRWKIQNMQDMFILGEDGPNVPKYKTVRELIKDHRGISGKPIEMENGEVVTLSKLYVHRPI